MSVGAWGMLAILVLTLGTLAFIILSMLRNVQNERTPGRSIWREFGLGIALMLLFVVSWVAHGFAEWQVFTDHQREHGQPTTAGDFVAQFAQSTLENWQSEFLQLFTFVALAALYIHKGSAESKDGTEKIEAALRRIEDHLGTSPPSAPTRPGEEWKLADTPLEVADRDHGPTRDDLYQRAKQQDIAGRSTMTKDELRDALDGPPD
jgi:hypothetical protein